MGAPNYVGDPDSARDAAIARRAELRMRGGGAALESFHSKLRPTDDFYDARKVLAFEAEHPKSGGRKEELIRRTFHASATRYQQRLYHLIHDDEENSRRIDAHTVNRLLKLEAERAKRRHYLPEGYAS